MKLHVGTSGYSYKEWKGKFYPADISAKKMLAYYSEHFHAVEINGTFRRLPTTSALHEWVAAVPKNFEFVLKAPQRITHFQRLRDADKSLKELLDAAKVLTARAGPLFFQLPPNFKKDVSRLREFLVLLPPKLRAAFEFRHQSWFDEDVFTLLRKHRVALCIADAEGDLKVPFAATAKWGYLRLRRAAYSDRELKRWVKRVQTQKWSDAYVFFKHEESGTGPIFAKRFLELAR